MENPNYILPICLYQNDYGNDLIELCEIGDFYVINPEVRPIPEGLSLFYVDMDNTQIHDIGLIYDMFNRDNDYFRFLAWLQPVPNTVPLYIYKENDVSISFKKENRPQYSFSPIYVLKEPMLFTQYQGRCIPSKNGIPFEQCIVGSTKRQSTLLSFFSQKEETNYVFYIVIICVLFFFYLKLFYKNKNVQKL